MHLNKGFQIHPDAFKILENVDVRKLEKIIKEIVREKDQTEDCSRSTKTIWRHILGIKDDPTQFKVRLRYFQILLIQDYHG